MLFGLKIPTAARPLGLTLAMKELSHLRYAEPTTSQGVVSMAFPDVDREHKTGIDYSALKRVCTEKAGSHTAGPVTNRCWSQLTDQCAARIVTCLVIAMAFLPLNMCSFAQEPTTDAAQLMREVLQNELQSQSRDQSHWRFREIREAGGKKELREVYQTECGDIYRLLAINDGLLNSKEAAAEHHRLRRLLSDPDKMREKQEEQLADSEKARKALNMLPEAFLYQYRGMEGQLIKLEFTPNQRFHPTDRAGEVFQHMNGSVLIDGQSKHLAAIDGRITDDVKFGGGLLGHLEKGGTFLVVRKDVGFGHWQLAVIDIEMIGKAMLFKTINIQQKKSYSNYTRLPDDMTLEEVASALMEQPDQANEAALR